MTDEIFRLVGEAAKEAHSTATTSRSASIAVPAARSNGRQRISTHTKRPAFAAASPRLIRNSTERTSPSEAESANAVR